MHSSICNSVLKSQNPAHFRIMNAIMKTPRWSRRLLGVNKCHKAQWLHLSTVSYTTVYTHTLRPSVPVYFAEKAGLDPVVRHRKVPLISIHNTYIRLFHKLLKVWILWGQVASSWLVSKECLHKRKGEVHIILSKIVWSYIIGSTDWWREVRLYVDTSIG